MVRLAAVCLVLGLGSELFAVVTQTSAPTALFLGFVSVTLSLILFVLGVPAIRDLVR
ncbi:MAG TPA: hypothetical protein VIZ58_06965 [Thermoanaerobaculia bacterium]